ncbi:MAG: glycosyltransferase family 1 protein [Bacteroidota bacterium]
MRIAINTRFLLPQYLEGLGNFTWEVSRRLVDRHPEHDFLFCFDRAYDPKYVVGDRTTAQVIWPPARRDFLWRVWFEFRLPQVLSSWRADVFLSPDGYCSLRSQVPTVMVTHDLAFLHYPDQVPAWALRYYRKWTPKFLDRAEHVVTVSEFVKQDILNSYSIGDDKISVSCNGVREIFKPLSEDEIEKVRQRNSNGKPYFFYLGSVHPRKNLTRLIKAYSRFRASGGPDYPLLLGGRLAWQLSEVQTAHEQSDYRSDIQFLDYLPTPEAARLLAASQALVYPSLSEGFGVPVLEAMQVDVPVITSNVTSLPEVAGDAAILIDPTSEEQLAQALLQISQNAELRNQMIERGRKQRQMFSWEKATDVVEEAIFAISGKN